MKKILLVLCLFATAATAQIGWSPDQCDSTYGRPKYIWERKDFSEGWIPDRQLAQPWQEVRVYRPDDGPLLAVYFTGDPGARIAGLMVRLSETVSQDAVNTSDVKNKK